MSKIELRRIDIENWRFVLYETSDQRWIGDFIYSPHRFVDLSMLIELTPEEKQKGQENRDYLIELADDINRNYDNYLDRALNREHFNTL